MGGVLRRLRQFRGDVGGEGAHAVEDIPVHDGGVSRGHQYDHGFPHGSAQTYHQGGENACGSHRKNNGADHLPAAGPQSLRGGDEGRGDVAQGVLGNGEDDRDDGKAHDESNHQGVALFIGHAEAVAPQVCETGGLEVPVSPQAHDAAAEADEGLFQPVAQVFPAEPGAEQDDGGHDDVFHTAAEFVAPGCGPGGPEPCDEGRQAGNEDGHAEQCGDFVFHSGGQVKGAEEAQHYGRKGGHDFHDGFYHPFDGRGHEVGRVNGGRDRYRDGEDKGVQGAFQRAEDQGHQGQLGFIIIRAAHGLPEPFGRIVPLIPYFPDQGFGAGFRVLVFQREEMDVS